MKKRNAFFEHPEEFLIVFLMSAMLAILFVQVVARYFFSYAFIWAEQAARILFVWVTFAGISLSCRSDMHLKLGIVSSFAPEWLKKKLYYLSNAFTVVFALFLSWSIAGRVAQQFARGQTFSAITWLPVWTMYAAGALGMLGMAARTFVLVFGPFFHTSGKEPPQIDRGHAE